MQAVTGLQKNVLLLCITPKMLNPLNIGDFGTLVLVHVLLTIAFCYMSCAFVNIISHAYIMVAA